MSEQAEDRQIAPYMGALQKAQSRFIEIAGDKRAWDIESIFAMQHIAKNDFAMQIANRNPMSVQLAMYNAASTGLTLNPANGYAYLVPRDGAIRLDISYKGLIKIATDTGSVEWARAELVYAEDHFEYNGPAKAPEHKANPFKPRGDLVGVYCIAKTHGGDMLTEVMDFSELEKIRSKSDAWAKKKAGPWAEWFGEMSRKAVIKRAQKTWPYTEKSDRLAKAVEIANDAEGGYSVEDGKSQKSLKVNAYTGALDSFNDEELAFLKTVAEKVQSLHDHVSPEDAADYLGSEVLTSEEYIGVLAILPYSVNKSLRKLANAKKKDHAVIEHKPEEAE